MSTVWDYDPSLKPPDHTPAGKVYDQDTSPLLAGIAELSISIGGLGKQVQRMQDQYDRLANNRPGDFQYAQTGTPNASGFLQLDLGAPPAGFMWQVRRIIVGPSVIGSTPTGVAWVFIQGQPPGANAAVALSADFAGSLPLNSFYGTHQLVVTGGEHVWVVFTGASSSVALVAGMKVEVFDESLPSSVGFGD